MTWDKEKIKTILPHREPFLFIDEIIDIQGTEKVVAIKNIEKDASFFNGHFPGKPVMPGVLITEAMAQASIILFSVNKPEIANAHPDYYLGKVKAEFLSPVHPGDQLTIEANNVKILDNAAITYCLARVNDTVTAKANLVFGIKPKELDTQYPASYEVKKNA
jgi:3-hydroxyacyl-[acyl-carrier-protein] dehydratase